MSNPVTPHTAANPSIAISTPANNNTAPTFQQPSLPPPGDFDILPDTHRLLSRLLHTSSQPPPTDTPKPANKDENAPLEIQHLATEAGQLRNKIRNARRKVLELPDIERSVEDQEEEMRWLEERIAALREVLGGLGRGVDGVEDVKEEDEMSVSG